MPLTRRFRNLLLAAVAAAGLAVAAPISTAGATLVYVTGGFPTVLPKLPAPEWVWSARDDGTAPHRLARGSMPRVSPNGKLVVYETYAKGQESLQLLGTAGGRPRLLLRNDVGAVAWSPDSRDVAAVIGTELGTRRLVLIDIASGRVARTLAVAPDFYCVAFSPHGSQLLFCRPARTGLASDIYRVPVRGGAPVALTLDHSAEAPVWGPKWIVFSRLRKPARANDAPKSDLYLMTASGTKVRRLTHTNPGFLLEGLFATAWSSNGKRLLGEFGGQDTSYADTVDPVTGSVRRVGNPAQGLIGYGLSRDGKTILATTGGPDPDDSNVVTIPYDGGKLHLLVRHARMPDWSAGYPG